MVKRLGQLVIGLAVMFSATACVGEAVTGRSGCGEVKAYLEEMGDGFGDGDREAFLQSLTPPTVAREFHEAAVASVAFFADKDNLLNAIHDEDRFNQDVEALTADLERGQQAILKACPDIKYWEAIHD